MTTDTHWKAIIAVYPGRPDQVSEDWSWFFNDIAEAFKEDSQVYVDAVYEGDSPKVTVGKATLDVQAYVAKGQAGYVLAMEGQEPLFVEYAMSAETIEAAKDYFAESDR